jgi:chromosome segregation ATPase
MLFSKEKAEMQSRIDALTAEVAEAKASLATITTERDAALVDLANARTALTEANAAHESAVTALNERHTAALAAKDTETEARVQREVTDALASAGVPEARLPGRTPSASTGDNASKIADLQAQIDASNDPLEKGKLAAQIITLMDGKPGLN